MIFGDLFMLRTLTRCKGEVMIYLLGDWDIVWVRAYCTISCDAHFIIVVMFLSLLTICTMIIYNKIQ